MKPIQHLTPFVLSVAAALLVPGCASTGDKPEKGPNGTIAYLVEIESSEAGARVEANGDVVGRTPKTLRIFGDKDGTFHNFGSQEYVIQVFPVSTNQTVQSKVFRTGGWFSPEDRVLKHLYFDLNLKAGAPSTDLPRYYPHPSTPTGPPTTYEPRGFTALAAPQSYFNVGAGHWISEVLSNGKIIKLEDGSFWRVSPLDEFTSSLWLPISDITVIDGDEPSYPYKLVNTDDNEIVNAKLLSK